MNVWKTFQCTSDRGGQLTANSKSLVQRQRRTDNQVSWVGNTAQEVGDDWQSVVAVYWRCPRRWRNAISQVLRGFVLLTPAHCYAELVLHTFWNVQPVQCAADVTDHDRICEYRRLESDLQSHHCKGCEAWRALHCLLLLTRNIYIFIHHNITESTEQKVQQKSTQKRKKNNNNGTSLHITFSHDRYFATMHYTHRLHHICKVVVPVTWLQWRKICALTSSQDRNRVG